ncbi:MAG: penicillin acylase family protein [Oligoflexales bacterium]
MRYVLKFMVTIFFVFMFILWFLIDKAQPLRDGKVNLVGLQEEVEVLYDSYGVPHIYAGSELDAYRTLGWVHAQDRLFQMEVLRRVSQGRLSEIFGASTVDLDKFHRTLGLYYHGGEILDSFKKRPVYKVLEAYLEGVNQQVLSGSKPLEMQVLDVEIEPFTAQDILGISAYIALSFSKSLETDSSLSWMHENLDQSFLAEWFPSTPKPISNPMMWMPPTDFDLGLSPWKFDGSNAWVVDATKSKSGYPMLANDPHMDFALPGVWYEAHLHAPDFEIYGHHVAGVPVAILGHNRKMAWGVTMFQNDDIILYDEKFSPRGENWVIWKGQEEKVKTRVETIIIKGQEPQQLTLKTTARGPIVSSVVKTLSGRGPVSMWWAFYDPRNDLLGGFYDLAHSNDIASYKESIRKILAPGLNILYAHRTEGIAWWATALLPQPDAKVPPFILPRGSLIGYGKERDFLKNPHLINPSKGYIVSANQEPETKDVAGYFSTASRAQRIEKLLKRSQVKLSPQHHMDVQLDHHSGSQHNLLQALVSIVKQQDMVSGPIEQLASWDGSYKSDDHGAPIYNEFLKRISSELFGTHLPKGVVQNLMSTNLIHNVLPRIILNPKSVWWMNKEHRKIVVQKSWNQTIDYLKTTLGPEPKKWTWGAVHTLELSHPMGVGPLRRFLNLGPTPISGARSEINNMTTAFSPGAYSVGSGPSTRRIIDLGNPTRSYGILPAGQSGVPFDKHYGDQHQMFVKGQYRYQLLNREDILEELSSRLYFEPGS